MRRLDFVADGAVRAVRASLVERAHVLGQCETGGETYLIYIRLSVIGSCRSNFDVDPSFPKAGFNRKIGHLRDQLRRTAQNHLPQNTPASVPNFCMVS